MEKSLSISFIFDFPFELSEFTLFSIGQNKSYFDRSKTEKSFSTEYRKNFKRQLEELLNTCEKGTPISAYFSGPFLEQLKEEDAKMLDSIALAVQHKSLTPLGGIYHNSLSSLYSSEQFNYEIKTHKALLKSIFKTSPKIFYNTDNIFYNNYVTSICESGYKATFAGLIEWYLGTDKTKRILSAFGKNDFRVFVVDFDLGQSVYKKPEMSHHFLQIPHEEIKKYTSISKLINKAQSKAEVVSIAKLIKHETQHCYNIKNPVIGNSEGKGFDAYNGNALQNSALKKFYALETGVRKTKDKALIDWWSALGSSSYLKKMATHENSSYRPYDLYNQFMNILNDLELRLSL